MTAEVELKPCPFCRVDLEAIVVDGTVVVHQYRPAMRHPHNDCILAGVKIMGVKECTAWNTRPTDREGVIEECARVAERANDYDDSGWVCSEARDNHGRKIAAAIRSLRKKE